MLGVSGIGSKKSERVVRGQLLLPTQGSTGGILIGGDVHLFRVNANQLQLSDQLNMSSAYAIRFRDADIIISSKADGYLDLDADTGIRINSPYLMLGTEATPNSLLYAEIRKCKVHADVRATPQEGDVKWDAVNHKLQVYNGSAWETVTSV